MRDAFGKVNTLHTARAAVDRPAARDRRTCTGGEEGLADAGISVARLIPNPWLFLEATGQVYRGDSAIFQAPDARRPRLRRPPARVPGPQRVHEPRPRRLVRLRPQRRRPRTPPRASSASTPRFRWRPLRRSIYTRFLARTELVVEPARAAGRRRATPSASTAPASTSSRGAGSPGARYDSSERADDPGAARHGRLVRSLTFWPSEFSQVRGQYRRTQLRARARPANEFLFQFLFSIGAHGAHPF